MQRFLHTLGLALLLVGLAGVLAARPGVGEGGTAGPRLSVGDAFNTDGPRRDGLFLGDRELSLDDFLRLAGEHERADQIRTRQVQRWGLAGIGAGVIVAGLVYNASAEDCSHLGPGNPDFEACYGRQNRTQHIGIGIALTGGAGIAWAVLMPSRRPNIHELRRLARDFNRRQATTVRVTPLPGGGALALRGTF